MPKQPRNAEQQAKHREEERVRRAADPQRYRDIQKRWREAQVTPEQEEARKKHREWARVREEQKAKGLKHCCVCREWKPLTDFSMDQQTTDGRRTYCRPCHGQKAMTWRQKQQAKDPEEWSKRRKLITVRNVYGLTKEEYLALGTTCGICGDTPPKPHVDHDHATGKVRGLLCDQCNNGLGRFHDSPELLAAAIRYLARHRIHSPKQSQVRPTRTHWKPTPPPE